MVLVGIGVYVVHFLGLGGPQFKIAESLLQSSITQTRQLIQEQIDHQGTQKRVDVNNNNVVTPKPNESKKED